MSALVRRRRALRLAVRAGLVAVFGAFVLVGAAAAPRRVRVSVDNAAVKAAPSIGAKSLANLALGTVLETTEKQGEWYKVELEKDGVKVQGFIHEMLVEEAPETPAASTSPSTAAPTGPDPAVEIENGIETARSLIRQEKDLAQAQERLDGLLARVFAVGDPKTQKSLAVEVYLWMGIGRMTQGDEAAALREFRKMFDVDAGAAREATRNTALPKADALLKLADQLSQGHISDFGLAVESDPPGARVSVDGKEFGETPVTVRSGSPKFVLEVRKAGYVPVREEVLLLDASGTKSYTLEPVRRDLALSSTPAGAEVIIDGRDTGQTTDCRLSGLPLGRHELRLTKSLYLDWSGSVELGEAEPAPLHADLVGTSYAREGGWGEKGSGLLSAPVAMASDAEGSISIVSSNPVRVDRFSPDGIPVAGGKVQAQAFRDLKDPVAAAVDARGRLYLVDGKRGIILKVSADGVTAEAWNGKGGGTSEFRGPSGIAFDAQGNVYVAESGNDRVKKYSAGGEFLKSWGTSGTKDGQFTSPRAIAVDARGEVFVLDKTRVQKFSADGGFLSAFGAPGKADGQFLNPQGLAVDAAGCVYVADTDNNRLQKFSPDGKLIVAWGGRGKENGRMASPVSVLVDARGRVVVLEKENERVQVFVVGLQGPGSSPGSGNAVRASAFPRSPRAGTRPICD